MILPDKYNKDYYENGIKCGISGYENYHYIPTRSYSEAISIHKNIKFDRSIDYGCAKGFLVHALNQLGHETIGVDISEYAISNCLESVKNKVFLLNKSLTDMKLKTDLLIAKDVLEHIPDSDVEMILSDFFNVCNKALLVIPLGDNDIFRIREYEIDKTHITKKDEDYWINKIKNVGFKIESFDYSFGDVKKKWVDEYPFGNGFFLIGK